MPWNPYSQNTNGTPLNPYTPGGYEKARLKKLLLIVIGILAAIAILTLVVHFFQPENQQSKYIKSATAAAREVTPNAKVANVKVAGGFALALVSDPTASGQAQSGNTTIFKVNADGSMKQIANGSYFGPLDLLGLGIPLSAQAKLTGTGVDQVKQKLAAQCDYDGGNSPGYSGFNSSFNPGGWRVSAITLDTLEQTLNGAISNKNSTAKPDKKIICVNAIRSGSSNTNGIFTIEVQFITSDGTITRHVLAYTIESGSQRSYTLDGNAL